MKSTGASVSFLGLVLVQPFLSTAVSSPTLAKSGKGDIGVTTPLIWRNTYYTPKYFSDYSVASPPKVPASRRNSNASTISRNSSTSSRQNSLPANSWDDSKSSPRVWSGGYTMRGRSWDSGLREPNKSPSLPPTNRRDTMSNVQAKYLTPAIPVVNPESYD
ncbi:hypothetical protein BJ085DRAFT_28563 [Dimargaris cristalligena]|uniref:Uncharacterized protein n=1 Tax=Dimargaris cristalligena TaxID=215637 RepID=A0A4P9ZUL1_9FUNG|nr:hypothetical protein BJ085DRAFT_28563 [Dimargaris cristalligena]|eukprot:RKP37254.1 hypothetical protein BJ085DRAFT_28563 [Dimargaris cristalligena]